MEETHLSLLHEVSRTLHLTQAGLAIAMGSSLRTVQRMYAGRTQPSRSEYGLLVRATYPIDPALAARIAAWVNGTLDEFGIAPPVTSAAQASVLAQAIDSVLFAAADVAEVPLSSVRRILAAAFARASELGVSMEMAAGALRAAKPPETG